MKNKKNTQRILNYLAFNSSGLVWFMVLNPLSTIFQSYRGGCILPTMSYQMNVITETCLWH